VTTSKPDVDRRGHDRHVQLHPTRTPCEHGEVLVCFDISCRHCGALLRDHVPVDQIRRAVVQAIDAHPCTRARA
jgi:hypothetical protein